MNLWSRATWRSPWFLVGLAPRLLLLVMVAGPDPRRYFLPFLDHWVLNPFDNPWAGQPGEAFPYGGSLFALLAAPRWLAHLLFGDAALGAGPLGLLEFKGPLLLADLTLLSTFVRLLPERRESLIKFYWLNPALFFITYVYGQLDLVSVTLVMVSVNHLLGERPQRSALAMGLALGCKFHVAIAVPLMLGYVWNREFARAASLRIATWLGIFTVTAAAALVGPALAHRAGPVTLGSPEVRRLFAMQIPLDGGDAVIYVGIVAMALILGRLTIATRISKFGLIWGITLLMSGLVFSSHAATGWYAWCLPFLALFFAVYLNVPRSLHWVLQGLFLALHAGPVIYPDAGAWSPEVRGLMFSLLEAALLTHVYFVWTLGARRELPMRQRTGPLRIGLSGDSGAGKSHLTAVIAALFGPGEVVVCEGDDYHRWERGHVEWTKYTHLNPRGNALYDLAQHVALLGRGQAITKTVYDHRTGRFEAAAVRRPSRVVMVEGLHTFYLRGARAEFDLKIFVRPDDRLRQAWKIQRDVIERGHDRGAVLASLAARTRDAGRFIEPQRDTADVIVELSTAAEGGDDAMAPTRARWTLWNDVDVATLADSLNARHVTAEISFEALPPDRVALTVEPGLTADDARAIAHALYSPLRHLTRGRGEPTWRAGFDGVSQLVALAFLNRHAEEIAP